MIPCNTTIRCTQRQNIELLIDQHNFTRKTNQNNPPYVYAENHVENGSNKTKMRRCKLDGPERYRQDIPPIPQLVRCTKNNLCEKAGGHIFEPVIHKILPERNSLSSTSR
jgi:hypothetical protein